MKRILSWLFVATFLLSATLVHAQWRYIDLNPPNALAGSYLWGVSATDQVGVTSDGFLSDIGARWQGSPGSAVQYGGLVYATDGKNQVGVTYLKGTSRATVWSGHPKSATPLALPSKVTSSVARALWNGSVGGETQLGAQTLATVWKSVTSSASIIHPTGYDSSVVYAMYSKTQAGVVDGRAATWSGSSTSYVDRHPASYWQSAIYGLHGNMAVGVASFASIIVPPVNHAAAWDLAKGTFSDLHPPQYAQSGLTGVSQGWASGFVIDSNGNSRAGVWDLATGTFTDLHSILPPSQYTSCSYASSIWRGVGTYVGGYACSANAVHAMLWYIPPD
jgi:hypothetical protein